MGRTKESNSKETWNRIVVAANEIIAETLGKEEPSFRAVARRAGVSTGTVSYYFSNKEELLEACLDRYYEGLGAVGEALLKESLDASNSRALVEKATRALYRYCWSERGAMRIRAVTRESLGQLPEERQALVLGPYVGRTAQAIGQLTGKSEKDGRLAVQSITYLIYRYVLATDEELGHILGNTGTREDVEDHITEVALKLVFDS